MRIQTLAAAAACTVGAVAAASNAQVAPIDVTGWNFDMVINNGQGANYADSVTATMDGGVSVEGWTWVEAGEYTNVDGNTQTFGGLTAGVQSSMTGNGTFEFQPFDQNNALNLQDASGLIGDLTLVTPGMYTEVAVYGAAAYGSKDLAVTLNFGDGSSTRYEVGTNPANLPDEYDGDDIGVGQDWFANSDSQAYFVGARASNKSEEGYTRLFYQESPDIHLYESLLVLDATDQGKLLESLTFENYDGDRLAIMAVSGATVPVPEPAALSLLGLGGLGLLRRRRA